MGTLIKIDFKLIVILVLVGVVFFQRACDRRPQPPPDTIEVDGRTYEVIKYQTDTVEVITEKVVYRPGRDIYHYDTVYVELPKDIDTLAILRDYYTKNVYRDTLYLDNDLGSISIEDTISQNRIVSRVYDTRINSWVVTETIVVRDPPRRQVFVGVNGAISKSDIIHSVGVGALYKNRKEQVLQLGVGVTNSGDEQITPYIGVGAYWKIRLR